MLWIVSASVYEFVARLNGSHASFRPPKACLRWLILMVYNVFRDRGAHSCARRRECDLEVCPSRLRREIEVTFTEGAWSLAFAFAEELDAFAMKTRQRPSRSRDSCQVQDNGLRAMAVLCFANAKVGSRLQIVSLEGLF